MIFGKEMLLQSSEQEPQLRHSSMLSAPLALLAVAPLSFLAPVLKTMHPSGFGCCLALAAADPFANLRRSGSAASGLSPALY